MKRSSIVFLALLALIGCGALATAVGASAPRARLREFVCHRALSPADRSISVIAVMRPVPQGTRMALKFELLSRTKPGAVPTHVTAQDLGKWISPADPTLGRQPGDRWIFKHPVGNLAAPATYHFRVSFRWSGAHGHVVQRAVRTTRSCYQPELRPDLLVQSITVKPIAGKADRQMYVALIRNRGVSAAGPFQVRFSYGDVANTRTVQGLGAHSKIKETFTGPVCTTDTAPTVTVDPNHQVDDYDESNNSLVANCSGSSGSASGP